MKKKLLRILEGAAVCAILVMMVILLSCVTERKESREKLMPFFEHAGQMDVLFLGNSHMLSAVYPMELFKEYGICGYNFGGYNNTIPLSYWLLRCALDYCMPELVVVDVDYVGKDEMLGGSSADVHTALDGIPLNFTKAQAIEDLMGDPQTMDDAGNRYADLKWEYYFPLSIYHSRWDSLNENDFKPEGNGQLGAQMNIHVAQPAEYSIMAEAAAEDGPGFSYLRKIIDMCRERGIEVLLVNLPFPANNPDDQFDSNAVYYIAQECGVNYIDFVYMDQIVDYATDCYDPASHLNPSGARKVTDYLGEYMCTAYQLKDHREDSAYASWHEGYDAYVNGKLQTLREQESLHNFLMLLHDNSLSCCVYLPKNSVVYGDEDLMRLLQNIGRRHLYEADTYESVWADDLFPFKHLDAAAQSGAQYLFAVDRGQEAIAEIVGDAQGKAKASFGELAYHADENGTSLSLCSAEGEHALIDTDQADSAVRIIVIDERTDGVVMNRTFAQ